MKTVPVLSVIFGLALQVVSRDVAVAAPQAAPGSPQTPPAAQEAIPVFGAESSVVLLDVVVRDKKGRLVKDLKQSDFEIYEDGDKQTLSSFRMLDRTDDRLSIPEAAGATQPAPGAAPAPPAAPAPAPSAEVDRSPMVIAFVFDRISVKAQDTAYKAAMAYTTKGHVEGDMVGVFSLDLSLRTLQPFTADLDAVRAAFGQVRLRASTPYAEQRETIRELAGQVERADQTLSTLASGGMQQDANVQSFAGSLGTQRLFDNMQGRMLQSFDRLERDQQGFSSTNGILALVSGLKALPGRKTIVFFSEGLSITTQVLAQFKAAVAAANRANVTVYAIDAAGLRVESDTKESRDELVRNAKERLAQEGRGGINGTDGAMMQGMEQVEDRLRSSPKAGLGRLAEDTGGFLVADSNDAARGFARIQEEMRFYYLLAYSPTDPRFDGRFREVNVKVTRPGTVVYSRKGYLSIPPDIILPVRTAEAPVLAELSRKPPADDFPVTALALSFPEVKRPGRVPVMIHMALSGVRFDLDKDKKLHRANFTMLARILDAKGTEVDRMSRDYPVSVPADKLEAAKTGDVFFFQETDLAPGKYTLETAVLDSLSKKASVRRSTVEVPVVPAGVLRLSSVIVLKRSEKLSAEEMGRDNPLYFGDAILYPNMGEPVRKSTTPALGFFFSAYVPAGVTAPKQAQVEIMKGATSLARLPIMLTAPNSAGRIQHAAGLPIQALEAGEYAIRVSVPSVPQATAQQARFVITD